MPPLLKIALAGLVFAVGANAAKPASLPDWDTRVWNLESGMLWEIGTGTPFDYQLVPTMLSWRSGEFFGRELDNGSRIVLRHRLTIIGTLIQHGPESHYFGVAGSPSLEWWNRTGTWSLYTGVGGGAGLLDSQGVKGGQGQDFTFNWFIRGGLEHSTSSHTSFSAGIMYQHMSNGGQTKPNPGIDALGFTLGMSLKY